MRLPKLSTLYAYGEQLSSLQRKAFVEYLISLDPVEDRESFLKEVEKEAEEDWKMLTKHNDSDPLEKPNETKSVKDLFYEGVMSFKGTTCRQLLFQYIKNSSGLSDQHIYSVVDREAKKCGIKKSGKTSVWEFDLKQIALPF